MITKKPKPDSPFGSCRLEIRLEPFLHAPENLLERAALHLLYLMALVLAQPGINKPTPVE